MPDSTRTRLAVALCWACGMAVTLLGVPAGAAAQAASSPHEQEAPHAQHPAASTARVFGSDAGMVLNFVKPDKTADFESIMARLRVALQTSDKPERKLQAASWKVFRASEPAAGGNVLYVFTIDPAIKDADYTISTILAEAFPKEVQTLYKQYAESYATGQNFVNLTLVSALGQ